MAAREHPDGKVPGAQNRGAEPPSTSRPQQRERRRLRAETKPRRLRWSPAPPAAAQPPGLGLQVTGIYWSTSRASWEGDTERQRWPRWALVGDAAALSVPGVTPSTPRQPGGPGCHLRGSATGRATLSAALGTPGRKAGDRGTEGPLCGTKAGLGDTPGHLPSPVWDVSQWALLDLQAGVGCAAPAAPGAPAAALRVPPAVPVSR